MRTLGFILRSAVIVTAFAVTACNKGDSEAEKLFKFKENSEDTKNVAVHLVVDFIVNDETGARIDTQENQYSLQTSVLKDNEFVPVKVVPDGLNLADSDAEAYSLPVTLSGSSFAFDAVVKVPSGLVAGDDGFSFLFNLVAPESVSLKLAASGMDGTLRSFKTKILPGTPALENPVALNLSTTITADLMDSLELGYTQESFDEVMAAIEPVLKTANDDVDDADHKSKPYVQGLVARTLMLLASDASVQETLVQVVVKNSGSGIASNSVMSKMNKAMSALSENSSKVLTSENDKNPLNVFKSEKVVQITEKATAKAFDSIYAPSSVSFDDSDTSSAIGGNLTIKPRSSAYAPAGYAVYLGGATKEAVTLQLLGKVKIVDEQAVLVLSIGTQLPSGVTHFWIYSFAEDETESSEFPKLVAITNSVVTKVQPTLTLTGPSEINDGGTVTLAGSCSPDGVSIEVTPPAGFTPSSGSCTCTASALASCTTFTESSASSPATFTANVTKDGLSASATQAVTIKTVEAGEVAATTFGAPFGNYMEDGYQALCVKTDNTHINCKGLYFDGDNDVTLTTGWTTGATIRGYFNLEASTYIDDTSGNVWSVGTSSSTPVGRSTTATSLDKITFSGLAAGVKLVGISGEHQRASALFDNGQVYSWTGSNSPAERLTSGVHTLPVKYIYDAFGQECFIDAVDDLYCKTSSASTASFQWTPSASEKALSGVASLTLPYNSGNPWDGVIKLTSGLIYTFYGNTPTPATSYTNTGITVKSSAGNFGFSYGIGNQQFLVVASNGKVYNASGEISGFGSENIAVGASYGGVGGLKQFVLSGDGKVYGSASVDMTSTSVFGDYDDVIAIRAFYQEFCAIRANGEIRCAGLRAGGTFASPTLMGTME